MGGAADVVEVEQPVPPGEEREQHIEDVHERVHQLCGVINAAHAELVGLIGVVVREQLWNQPGIASPAHWLRWQAGLGVAQSEAFVRLAAQLSDLPATAAAFRRGALSVDQVKVIARHVPPAYDDAAANLATQLMVPQLANAVRRDAFEPPAEAPPDEPEPEDERTYLSFGHRDDGFWYVSGRLAPEDGAVVERALGVGRDAVYQERRQEVPEGDPVEASWAEALLHLVDQAAGNPDQPRAIRDRYRLLVHLDADTLQDWSAGRRPELQLGPWLGRSIVDRITCDTDARTVLEEHGLAVAFGPAHPTIPARLRDRIENRDRGCRFPGCRRRRGLEVHHLVHRAHGGWTVESNLLCLCSRHHHDHHRGEFTITGDPTGSEGLQFRSRHGSLIEPAPPDPSGAEPPAGEWRHPAGYRLDRRWLQLNPRPAALVC